MALQFFSDWAGICEFAMTSKLHAFERSVDLEPLEKWTEPAVAWGMLGSVVKLIARLVWQTLCRHFVESLDRSYLYPQFPLNWIERRPLSV